MDSSSRKIVGIFAIITLTVLAVMAATFYKNSQNVDSTAAVEPPAPLNDQAEADMAAGTAPKEDAGFSTDVPKSEDIPAINGEPSMVFDNAGAADPNVAKESTKGIAGPSVPPVTPDKGQ